MPAHLAALAWLSLLSVLVGQDQGTPATANQHQFRVIVEDDRGRPAKGVMLVLGHDGGDVFGFSTISGAAPVTTDSQGTALLQCDAQQPLQNLFAEAQILIEPPIRLGLQTAPDGGAPHRLRLPPLGQVRVLAYDEQEHPLAGVTGVDLALQGNKRFFDRMRPVGTLQAEGALFSRVALGQQLLATATLQNTNGTLSVQQAGPTRAGELVVIDLRLRAANLLTMRVVGKDGVPATNTTLGAFLRTSKTCKTASLTTDADGMLRYLLPAGFVGEPDALLHLVRRGDSEFSDYLGATRVSLAEDWRGTRACGDVSLQDEPSTVGGTLVDPDGKPMAGVVLTASLSVLQSAQIQQAEREVPTHRVRTDAAGHFVFRELEPFDTKLLVQPEGDVFLLDDVTVHTDDKKAMLKGARPGSAIVQLPGLPAGMTVRCVALRRSENQGPGSFDTDTPTKKSTANGLEFSGLRPGTYDLEIGTSGLGGAAHRIGGFQVHSGARCEDPRLRVLDWQDYLRLVHCTFEGDPALRTQAQLMVGEVQSNGYAWQGMGSLDRVRSPFLVVRNHKLAVFGPACESIVVDDPAADLKLTLTPRPQVRLSLPPKITLPANLHLILAADDRPWLDTKVLVVTGTATSWNVTPDGHGKFTAILQAPRGNGEYDEVWRAGVVVPEGQGPHALELPIDEAAAQLAREVMNQTKK
jgi:hypothetical protein